MEGPKHSHTHKKGTQNNGIVGSLHATAYYQKLPVKATPPPAVRLLRKLIRMRQLSTCISLFACNSREA